MLPELPTDEAEAVLLEPPGAVPRREEVQLVDHVVVATDERPIDPRRLNDVQLECAFHELAAHAVGAASGGVLTREVHRDRAAGYVVCAKAAGELHVEVADRL